MKKLNLLVSILTVTLLAFSVMATAAMLIPASEKGRERGKADNAPVIEQVDSHWILTPPGLEKRVFIHYAKPGTECGNGICEPGENAKKCPADCAAPAPPEPEVKCYGFLGKGVKWKELPVTYVIDPDNPDGLSESFVTAAISAGAEEWDAHTSAELFGTYSVDYNASWDSDAPDGKNELLFGNYPEEGVIAVTVTWGYFRGPPKMREIIEFDVLFDTNFTWGNATFSSSVMDLQNIATHELGHGAGLDDLYEIECSEETMYGYSDYGETKKRTLEAGDIAGIQELYGA